MSQCESPAAESEQEKQDSECKTYGSNKGVSNSNLQLQLAPSGLPESVYLSLP